MISTAAICALIIVFWLSLSVEKALGRTEAYPDYVNGYAVAGNDFLAIVRLGGGEVRVYGICI